MFHNYAEITFVSTQSTVYSDNKDASYKEPFDLKVNHGYLVDYLVLQ